MCPRNLADTLSLPSWDGEADSHKVPDHLSDGAQTSHRHESHRIFVLNRRCRSRAAESDCSRNGRSPSSTTIGRSRDGRCPRPTRIAAGRTIRTTRCGCCPPDRSRRILGVRDIVPGPVRAHALCELLRRYAQTMMLPCKKTHPCTTTFHHCHPAKNIPPPNIVAGGRRSRLPREGGQ